MQNDSMCRKLQSLARPPPPLPQARGGARTARSRARRSLTSSEAEAEAAVAAPLMFDQEVYVLPAGEWMRRRQAKEVLKRALTPPKRRPSLRWRNFQPRPSPLSVMSTA